MGKTEEKLKMADFLCGFGDGSKRLFCVSDNVTCEYRISLLYIVQIAFQSFFDVQVKNMWAFSHYI